MVPDLPSVTLVIVDCVQYNRARVAFDHCLLSCNFGEAKFLSHFDMGNKYDVRIEKISSIEAYSHFMVKELANYVETEHVLVAQWDGFVWHPEMWDNEFLKYDYIGAPWFDSQLIHGAPKKFNVGNGGFSLRSKRLQDFLRDDDNLVIHPKAEDITICQWNRAYLEKCGFKFAPKEVAEKFAIENGPLKPAFGVHGRIKLVKE